MNKVICNQSKKCRHRTTCGGAKPHTFDDNECNKCPMNLNAKCIEVEVNK